MLHVYASVYPGVYDSQVYKIHSHKSRVCGQYFIYIINTHRKYLPVTLTNHPDNRLIDKQTDKQMDKRQSTFQVNTLETLTSHYINNKLQKQ